MPYDSDPMNLSSGTQIGGGRRPVDPRTAAALAALRRQTLNLSSDGDQRLDIGVTGAPGPLSVEEQRAARGIGWEELGDDAQPRGPEVVARGGLVGGPEQTISRVRPATNIDYGSVQRRLAEIQARQADDYAREKAGKDAGVANAAAANTPAALDQAKRTALEEKSVTSNLANADLARQAAMDKMQRVQAMKDQYIGRPADVLPEGQPGPVRPAQPGALGDLSPMNKYRAEFAIENGQQIPDFTGEETTRQAKTVTLDEMKRDAAKKKVEDMISAGDIAGARQVAQPFGLGVNVPDVEEYMLAENGGRGAATALAEDARTLNTRDLSAFGDDPTEQDVADLIARRDQLMELIRKRTGADPATAKARANQTITDAMRAQRSDYATDAFGDVTTGLLARLKQ